MPWECMFFTHAALPERFSLGMKQTGSALRADTNHFYNCLQQERKHELNSSVVDGSGGETRMNCQQDGFCFYPGICCCSLCSGCPVQSLGFTDIPRRCGPHCAVWSQGPGRHLWKRICQVCQGRESSPQGGIWSSPHPRTSSVGGGTPVRGSDLSKHPPTSGVSLSPSKIFKRPRQQ